MLKALPGGEGGGGGGGGGPMSHKQSFLNLLRQNSRHVTMVYCFQNPMILILQGTSCVNTEEFLVF